MAWVVRNQGHCVIGTFPAFNRDMENSVPADTSASTVVAAFVLPWIWIARLLQRNSARVESDGHSGESPAGTMDTMPVSFVETRYSMATLCADMELVPSLNPTYSLAVASSAHAAMVPFASWRD